MVHPRKRRWEQCKWAHKLGTQVVPEFFGGSRKPLWNVGVPPDFELEPTSRLDGRVDSLRHTFPIQAD
jgi:hypothetical protein